MKRLLYLSITSIIVSTLLSCSGGPKYTMLELSNLNGQVKKEVKERKLVAGNAGDEFTMSQEFDKNGAALYFKNTIYIRGGQDTIDIDMTIEQKEGKLYKMVSKDNTTLVTAYNEDELWTDLQIPYEHEVRTVKIIWNGNKLAETRTKKDGQLVMKEKWTFNDNGDHATYQLYADQGGEEIELLSTETFSYDLFDDNDNWTKRTISSISESPIIGRKEVKKYVETRELTYF